MVNSDSTRGLLDAFDALIDGNRQQLDELYGQSDAMPSESVRQAPQIEEGLTWSEGLDRQSIGEGQSVVWLNQHFPNAWRYEIRDRRRQDNEVVVLCRLELIDHKIHKAQFGSAMIPTTESGEYRNERETESVAYELAVDDALRRCIQYL
jgi:glucan phosphorylase